MHFVSQQLMKWIMCHVTAAYCCLTAGLRNALDEMHFADEIVNVWFCGRSLILLTAGLQNALDEINFLDGIINVQFHDT